MHVHIARAKRDATKIIADPAFIPISQSASTCTFFYQVSSRISILMNVLLIFNLRSGRSWGQRLYELQWISLSRKGRHSRNFAIRCADVLKSGLSTDSCFRSMRMSKISGEMPVSRMS